MKKITTFLLIIFSFSFTFAQNDIDIDAGANWIAFMNVFELPANGGGYAFGSTWALADTKTTLDVINNTVTLQPNFNTYANSPTDAYWVDQSTGIGNKDMEASTFVEPDSTFNSVDLTFSGNVISNTLDTNYSAVYFIKALDPANGYSDALGGAKIFDLPASGIFTVSATAAELQPGLVIQYGFAIRGTNANPVNEQTLGSVVIGSMLTSVNKIDETPSSVAIYPNPANDVLTIQTEKNIEAFKVVNTVGVVVMEGANSSNLDISNLNSGTYFIEFTFENRKEIQSFIKL